MPSRRHFLSALASATAAPLFARDFGPHAQPLAYPDPDILVLDPSFGKYVIGNTPLKRLHTGCLWAEGPAWNGTGNYLVWSDIPNNAQMRWLPEDGHVSVLRNQANNSNGNTFDAQGRQISAEHGSRRVARYELDGRITVLAEKFEGKPFNAPNDVVVHPDGAVWFTDPGYGSMGDYEGNKGALELKESVYRIDPSGTITKVTDAEAKPNGLCFSPDYKRLYVVDTGAPRNIRVYDVVDNTRLENGREFTKMKLTLNGAEVQGGSDGVRCDVDGNVWSSAGGPGEFNGVHVFNPEGQRIGRIRLPEKTSNVCFGGIKRNRLFMTASQSLYTVYVNTRGAHWC